MKITPKTRPDKTVDFETLEPTDTFLYQGAVWMKVSDNDQDGVSLSTGEYQSEMCGAVVVPVDATLTWKHKKVTPKKKK